METIVEKHNCSKRLNQLIMRCPSPMDTLTPYTVPPHTHKHGHMFVKIIMKERSVEKTGCRMHDRR